jgi:hypothetical protein
VAHAEDEQAVDGYSKLKVCVVMFMTDLPVERERERKRRGGGGGRGTLNLLFILKCT